MTEQEEFEFRLRFEQEQGAAPKGSGGIVQYIKDDLSAIPGRIGNLAAGAVRGAGSIGATLLSGARGAGGDMLDAVPANMRPQATSGVRELPRGAEMRAGMDAGLRELGADPNSVQYQVGKVGTEIAGTAGVGGALARGAQAVGAAPTVVNALRTGGMSGGGNMLTRAAGGAANGGAMAAMVDPEQAGKGAGIGTVLPGAVRLAGAAGNALYGAAEAGAQRLMQSAIKPTIAQLRTGDAQTAVDTLLQYGISPTREGVNRLRALIDDLNSQISNRISSSTATVDKQNVLNALGDVRSRFANQVSPTKDLNAIQGVADDFVTHPQIPSPQTQIPVQQAQEMKQGTYRVLSKKYGEAGSAETEAQKGLARGLKEEIATAVPGIGPLNAEESRLLTTLGVAERRALMELNKNPVGLTALAHNPLAAAGFLADRSAAFKALAARMIHNATPAAGTAGQSLIGAASNPLLRAGGLVTSEGSP